MSIPIPRQFSCSFTALTQTQKRTSAQFIYPTLPMLIKSQLIRAKDHSRSAWSGGTTTELAISPANGSYARRQFRWRLSSATVTAPSSIFTALPGFTRQLLILSGRIQLTHEKPDATMRATTLTAFEQACFDGDWVTSSRGQAVDFNLMMTEGMSGSLAVLRVKPEAGLQIHFPSAPNTTHAFYLWTGSAAIQLGDEVFTLHEQDLLLLAENSTPPAGSITAAQTDVKETILIHAQISEPTNYLGKFSSINLFDKTPTIRSGRG